MQKYRARKFIQVSKETKTSIEHVARVLDLTVPALMDSIGKIDHADSLTIGILRLVLFGEGDTANRAYNKDNNIKNNVKDYEKQAILESLRSTDGNITQSAKQLNISRGSLYRRISIYGITIKASCAATKPAR